VKGGGHLAVEESQKMLMREFEMKMMPNPCEVLSITPVAGFLPTQEQNKGDYSNWEWQNYPRLHLYDIKLKPKRHKPSVNGLAEEMEPATPTELINRQIYDQI
jgi:hypothetical protein